jgi:hypothetical protein
MGNSFWVGRSKMIAFKITIVGDFLVGTINLALVTEISLFHTQATDVFHDTA